jgi:drug/metabolite transporter superfamily protein YnfA
MVTWILNYKIAANSTLLCYIYKLNLFTHEHCLQNEYQWCTFEVTNIKHISCKYDQNNLCLHRVPFFYLSVWDGLQNNALIYWWNWKQIRKISHNSHVSKFLESKCLVRIASTHGYISLERALYWTLITHKKKKTFYDWRIALFLPQQSVSTEVMLPSTD